MALRSGIIVVSVLATWACGDSTYQRAAVGGGIAVAATGIYRAVTGDCWARCRPGLVCNQRNGVCEPGECAPACAIGSHCLRTADGDLVCTPDSTSFPSGSRRATGASRGSTGVGADGGAATAVDAG